MASTSGDAVGALHSIEIWPFDPLRRKLATVIAQDNARTLAVLASYDALDWRSQLRLAYLLRDSDPDGSDRAFHAAYAAARMRN